MKLLVRRPKEIILFQRLRVRQEDNIQVVVEERG